MKHSHVLDIPLDGAYKVDPIAHCQSLQPFVDTNGYRLFIINNADVFNEAWLAKFPVAMTSTSFVFVREPCSQDLMPAVHKDYFPPDRGYIYAINYTLQGCESSRLMWYENADGTPAVTQYPDREVVEVDCVVCPSDRPLLMDTTTYHGIKVGDTERWVMSLRPVNSSYDSNNPITWSDVIEQYRNIFMSEITQEMKITAIAGDIYDGMTQKEVDAFVIRQIEASLELLPETDVNGMYEEILEEMPQR
jgi:hypothetical protein